MTLTSKTLKSLTLKSLTKQALFAIHPLIAFATVATAADFVALRPEATVSTGVVRLGDLVTGAGDKADVPLFRSPDLGKVGTIRAETIAKAAEELGIKGLEMRGLSAITVARPAREIAPEETAALVRAALVKLDASLADSTVAFDTPPQAFMAPRSVETTIKVPFFDLETGRFSVSVETGGTEPVMLSGVIESRLTVPVLTRSIGRGDVISPSDYSLEPRPRRSLPMGVVSDTTKLKAVVAKRQLKPGQILRADDVTGRDLVERNQKVSVSYQQPGMNLTLSGKALAAGPQGALVQVQNLQSKRTFDAIVTGPGTVSAKIY